MDTNNKVHITWYDNRDGNYEIYYTKLDNNGTTLVDDTRLTTASASSWDPAIAVDTNNKVHITWYDYRDGNREIYYTKLDNTGNTLVDDTRLTTDSASSVRPEIAVDTNNNVHITWYDYRDGNREIYYTKLDNNGTTLVDDTRLTTDSAVSQDSAIAVDTNNNVHITWYDSRDGNYEIYYTKLDNNGTTLVDDTRLTTASSYSYYPAIAVDTNNKVHITWHDYRDGNYEIYYTKLDNNGTTLVGDTRLTTASALSEKPRIAVDTNNKVHITWYDNRDGNYEIYYTKLDNNGTTLVDDTRLTTASASSWDPEIAVDTNNHVHITWQDHRDGNYEIYYKHSVGSTPTPSAADIYVTQSGWWHAGGVFKASNTPIQHAIDNATAGDSIFVYNGSYTENVVVNKRLTLQGEGADVVIVTAAASSDHVFEVTADYVNISGFTVTGATSSSKAGFYLYSANHSNISDNNASNNYHGISLYYSSNNTLSNNTASNNSDSGIYLTSSSNNILYHNNLVDNTNNAYDDSDNQWDSGAEGNHYSDYTGTDSNGDGIGDTQYSIPGGSSVDRYPLMAPWGESNGDSTPPIININSPTDGATFTTSTITVSGTASDDIAVASVTVNGILATGTTSWSKGITLTAGANTITVVATDTSGNTATDSIDVTYTIDSDPSIITVDDSGGADYTTIQAAIDAATTGDTIEVNSGTYYENVNVNKRLTLRGIGMPVVDADGSGSAITLAADGVVLEGFTATGGGSYPNAGIAVTSSNNTLSGNTASNNSYYGIRLSVSSNNTLSGNTASNNTWYGIYLSSSSNNTLSGNTASNNNNINYGYGIYLYYSSYNTLSGNTASNNNDDGIRLYSSSYNTFSGNTASNNRDSGIYLHPSSSYNTFSSNTATNNRNGIYLSSSRYNILYHNNLVDNTNNAYDDSDNQWDSGAEGNHYSDYTGTDSNGDGIGDTQYSIPGGSSVDRYPLMAPWGESNGDSTPPIININSPTDGATFTTSTITVSGTASDDIAVASVTVNGILATGTTSWSKGITLTAGANTITVVATDTSGNTATDSIDVTYTIDSDPSIITVDDSGGADYTTIQAAIDAAAAGDTIEVNSGTYFENVNVDKSLTIRSTSENHADTIVQANNSNDHVFNVTADYVNISGFTVKGASNNNKAGIYLGSGVDHCNISDNNALNNDMGIYLKDSSHNTLTNNTANSNINFGILLSYPSNYNTLQNNTASNNNIGIYLESSSYNTLTNNIASNNSGPGGTGIYLLWSSNGNTLVNNIANSNSNYGISLKTYSGSNNILYHNNLVDNANNAYDDSNNQWDSGAEGNYYSDYTGTDSDGDGIGDTQYSIPGGSSVDRYPLMQPWAGSTPQKGDLNSDGTLTTADAAIALEIAAGSRPCDAAMLAAADVSGDDRVTSLDALMILQAAKGHITL